MNPIFIKLHPKTEQKLISMEREAALDGSYRVAKRIRAILLNSQKKTSGEIALILGAARSKVSKWLKNYSGSGVQELMEGKRSGRPCQLEDLQKIMLCDIIGSGPVAYGLESGVWTAKLVTQIIEEEFDVTYHSGHVWKLLQDFGFSVQSPKRLLLKAGEEKRSKWIKETYPGIKKSKKRIIQNSF